MSSIDQKLNGFCYTLSKERWLIHNWIHRINDPGHPTLRLNKLHYLSQSQEAAYDSIGEHARNVTFNLPAPVHFRKVIIEE
jgi:hypothetical protein